MRVQFSNNIAKIVFNEDDVKKSEKCIDSIHYIHVLDRSGSMYGSIKQLIENVKSTLNYMTEQDILSIVWFSSSNQVGVLLKGANPKLIGINSLLDSIAYTLGCTCFSSPLEEVGKIVEELKSLNSNIIVSIFTDGEPVTDWSEKEEIDRVTKIVKEISPKVLSINTIGYKNYYNKEFLINLSKYSKYGKHVHSSNIEEYKKIVKESIEEIKGLKFNPIKVESAGSNIVYMNKDKTLVFAKDELNLEFINGTYDVFYIENPKQNPLVNGKPTTFDEEETLNICDIYAFNSAKLFQSIYEGDTDSSYTNSIKLKDKSIFEAVQNSFTNDEKKLIAEKVKENIFTKDNREYNTLDINSLPTENEFCVMDLLLKLKELEADYVPVKNYSRIGLKSEDSSNNFEMEDILYANFKDLVFNESKLNVNIRVVYKGNVKIDIIESKRVGFIDNIIKAKIFRNYNIIKDGFLNIPKFSIKLPVKELKKLKKLSSHEFITYVDTKEKYIEAEIDLEKLPVINRDYGKKADNLNLLLEKVVTSNKLKSTKKTLKYLSKGYCIEIIDDLTGEVTTYTPEQLDLLKNYGLTQELVYNGVETKVQEITDNTDFYMSRELEFSLKGWSTIPKIEDVIEKIKNNKKLNVVEEVIKLTLDNETFKDKESAYKEMELVTKEINKLEAELAILRISKGLNGCTWKGLDLDTKGNYIFINNGYELIIKVKRTKVYFSN